MPRKWLSYVSASVLFALASPAFSAGWSQPLTVDRLMTEGTTDLIVVFTTGGSEYTTGCVVDAWIFEANTNDRRNRAYSMILAALAGGKQISLYYADTCGSWSYHKATSIRIHN